MESNVPSFFVHNMSFLRYSALRYVFKLIGFSPNVRPEMRQFFEFFVNFI